MLDKNRSDEGGIEEEEEEVEATSGMCFYLCQN